MIAPTPDFASYPCEPRVTSAKAHNLWVEVGWADDTTARFHHIWLADNAADSQAIDPHSREKLIDICDLRSDIKPIDVSVSPEGALAVRWSRDRVSLYHPGWLRAHRYDPPQTANVDRQERRLWDASDSAALGEFCWAAVETDPDTRLAFLESVRSFGLGLLTDGPTTAAEFQQRIQRLFVIRNMNWGMFFDVIFEPDGRYISNKAVNIVPHTDGPTREYQIGVMIFHCLVNSVDGGNSFWVDGHQVARRLEADDPESFRLLSTVPWPTGNRSPDSAYKYEAPLIEVNPDGSLGNIRDTHWLREPLVADFDIVEAMYRAYRAWSQLTRDPANQIHRRLEPGQTAVYDNRRVLHARAPYDGTSGHRHMHACYSELEELNSAIALITRTRTRTGAERT